MNGRKSEPSVPESKADGKQVEVEWLEDNGNLGYAQLCRGLPESYTNGDPGEIPLEERWKFQRKRFSEVGG